MSESSLVFWAAFGGGAAAGLFTLIAVLGAEWIRWFIDRPTLKVNVKIVTILLAGPGSALAYAQHTTDRDAKLFLIANNPHTKPVTVHNMGLGVSSKSKHKGIIMVLPQPGFQFPFQIDGGKSLTQWKDVPELIKSLRESGRTPKDLKWAGFTSVFGKTFRCRIKQTVIQQLEQAFSSHVQE